MAVIRGSSVVFRNSGVAGCVHNGTIGVPQFNTRLGLGGRVPKQYDQKNGKG